MVLGHLSKSYRNSWIAIQGDKLNKEYLSLAASSASVEEQANSALKDGKFPDGTTPVKVERRIWRAQVKSQYVEPEFEIDPSSSLDFLYENLGKKIGIHCLPGMTLSSSLRISIWNVLQK